MNGDYMLTELKPEIHAVNARPDVNDAYVVAGDSIGQRHLCSLILRVLEMEPLQRLQSVEVELIGRKL